MSSSPSDQPDQARPDATSARPDDAVHTGAPESETDEAAAEAPQDMTLLVDPARVRRAPRYPVFLWIGALVGVVAGLGFATWLVGVTGSGASLMKPGVYVTVVVLATTALGMGVAGLLALFADRRSLRRR